MLTASAMFSREHGTAEFLLIIGANGRTHAIAPKARPRL
jgi:hypothetical protein